MEPGRFVRSVEDVMTLMDSLFEATADRWSATDGGAWWDTFYADRGRPVPFFVDKPDENLVEYLNNGTLRPGRALDLGCGAGRNAIHLASHGFQVDAIDLSETAVAWARERAADLDTPPRFVVGDAFGDAAANLDGSYELIYDSGCLHHLPPHRRVAYLQLVERLLRPGGHLAVVCFAEGAMGSSAPDDQLYLRGGLEGGLAFSPESLSWIFQDLEQVEVRMMRAQPESSPVFGEPFLLTALFQRR
ncbi:class I SAM-dependent methyltransferase [Aeromicrobium alkaliterrae]|uniref:Class I SAM-dependent methyltransferase n=1 Tax=Aeromicrobium alkaliterrae TaxID=302168 RepID=A0ABN2JK02_9ACTN